jgi:hypothetical protein
MYKKYGIIIFLIKKLHINWNGWSTNRKIIVFESDDWGSIRMPSVATYHVSKKLNLNPDSDPYNRFDCLENSEDIYELIQVLLKNKNESGKNATFTLNFVMSNPDFNKIKDSKFSQYYFEPFNETYDRYYPNQGVFKSLLLGIEKGLFFPQFHGREHVNVNTWLKLLRRNQDSVMKAFQLGYWGIPKSFYQDETRINIQATYDNESIDDIEIHKDSIEKGLELFHQIFKFYSESFIPNNYIFDKENLKDILLKNKVTILQGMKYHKSPKYLKDRALLQRRYLGKGSDFIELVRNVDFEPAQSKNKDQSFNECLRAIDIAFKLRKPAIINSHRVNYIGGISKTNREENLKLLDQLLKRIIKKYPDVEFMNSVQLAEIIKNSEIA